MRRHHKAGMMAVIGCILFVGLAAWGQCLTEVEGNDSVELADFVADLPGGGCISGQIQSVGDVDYYWFTVYTAGWVTIQTWTTEDTEIALLDASEMLVAQNDDVVVGDVSSSITEYLIAGNYIVVVWEHGNDNVIYDYTLDVSLECMGEFEDNDSADLADILGTIPGELCVSGSIGWVGDLDVYQFEVVSFTSVAISTVTTEDTEIGLYDVYGDLLVSNDDADPSDLSSFLTAGLPAGIYYVIVWEHGDDNVIYDYTLVVESLPCLSEVESNDEPLLADDFGVIAGPVCTTGSIDLLGDLDYFTFTITVPSLVTLSTETFGDTELALYTDMGTLIAANDDVAVGNTQSWISQFLSPGTYFVAVWEHQDDETISTYNLTIDVE